MAGEPESPISFLRNDSENETGKGPAKSYLVLPLQEKPSPDIPTAFAELGGTLEPENKGVSRIGPVASNSSSAQILQWGRENSNQRG